MSAFSDHHTTRARVQCRCELYVAARSMWSFHAHLPKHVFIFRSIYTWVPHHSIHLLMVKSLFQLLIHTTHYSKPPEYDHLNNKTSQHLDHSTSKPHHFQTIHSPWQGW